MAVLHILTVPHPVLAKKCRPVGPGEFGADLRRFVSDLAETMYAAPGVGLAAPQVGDLRRVIVVDPGNSTSEQDDDGRPTNPRFLALVNPQVIETSADKMVYEEGCLSVPDFEENISRPRRVYIRYLDEDGKPHQKWFEGYDAIVVQHEMDHLEGTVILDRVSRMKKGRYLQKRQRVKIRLDGTAEYDE
ncbi:MAG: peptide deformylase [Deltaproteobacteria bacterium]|nr:peptide deformylase [Deltaproteobacteria bacterium]